MTYTPLRSTDFPAFYAEYTKAPHVAYLNMLPPDEGRVLLAKGLGNTLPEDLPDCLDVVDTMHRGGVFLGFQDNIALVAMDTKSPKWREQLLAFLRSRGLDAQNNGNDVTVEGYKVAGYGSRPLDAKSGLTYHVIDISIYMDLDLLQQVITKPIRKVPRGLSHWGITRQEVLDALEIE